MRQALFSRDSKIALLIFLLLFSYYLLIMSGEQYSSPGFRSFQTARMLVGHGTVFFDPPLRWGADRWNTSITGIGQALVYVPALVPLRFLRPELFAKDFFDPNLEYNMKYLVNDLYLYAASWTMPLLSALACVFLYLIARRRDMSVRYSVFATLICGVASPFTPQTKWDMSQPTMTFCLLGALWFVMRGLERKGYGNWIGAGLLLAFGILNRLEMTLLLPFFVLLIIMPDIITFRPEWRKRLVPTFLFLGAASLGLVGYMFTNWIRFGSPLNSGYASSFFDGPTFLEGMSGFVYSPGEGMLWYFPLFIPALIGLWGMLRKKLTWAFAVGGMIFFFWFFYGGIFDDWGGGWSWGPRYLVPFVPLLSYLAVEWLSHQKIGWNWQTIFFTVLLVEGFIVTWNGILFNHLAFFGNYFRLHPDNMWGPANNFVLEHSPLYAGWDFQRKLHRLDLFWLYHLKQSRNIFSWLGFFALVGIFLASAVGLTRTLLIKQDTELKQANT